VLQAEREVVWLDPDDPDDPREVIDVGLHVDAGHLERTELRDAEVTRFVSLAGELDDGEAATLAIAEVRGFAVATDDRKARRVLTTLDPQPLVTSTAAILRAWAANRGAEEVRRCLRLIERRASFLPPRSDPDTAWWREAATDAS
jgi:predicted nucleic acid-binding protein